MSGSTRATSEINGVACKHPSNKLTCMFCCSISIMGGVGAGSVMETWKCALCCFCSQRSIRPQVVTTFELPGCHDMWTVISNEVKEDKKVLQSPRSLTATRYSLSQSFFFFIYKMVFPHLFSHRLQKAAVSQMMSQRRTGKRMEKREKKSRTRQRRRRRRKRTRNPLQRRT